MAERPLRPALLISLLAHLLLLVLTGQRPSPSPEPPPTGGLTLLLEDASTGLRGETLVVESVGSVTASPRQSGDAVADGAVGEEDAAHAETLRVGLEPLDGDVGWEPERRPVELGEPRPLAWAEDLEPPRELRYGDWEGEVLLALYIDPSGTPSRVWVVESSGEPLADRDAVDYAYASRWSPATWNGDPIGREVRTLIRYRRLRMLW